MEQNEIDAIGKIIAINANYVEGSTSISNSKCAYCGGIHYTKCPLVKAISYHPDGTVDRVEFMTPNDYPPWPPAQDLKVT